DGQVSQAQAEEFGLFELEDSIGSDEELAEEIRTISQETKEAVEPQQISQPQPKKSVFRNMKFWK
ncbi:hypothetical protein N8553_03830, partial [bacterium]|nr:hypothetical protein [bacterium]